MEEVFYNPPGEYPLSLEVLSIAQLQQRGDEKHFLKPQRVDFYLLLAVTAGACEHMVDFEHVSAGPGTWLLLRPGQVQRFDFSRPWQGLALVVRPEFLQPQARLTERDLLALSASLDRLPSCLQAPPDQHEAALQTLQQMGRDAALPVPAHDRHLLLRHQLHGLIWRLHLLQGQPPSEASMARQRFGRFEQLLHLHLREQHGLAFYAEALACSAKSLSRACLEATGRPAKAVLRARLLLEARRLLAHTVLPVKTIADVLGFEEPTHFVKFFRQEAGCTPGAFRREQSGGHGTARASGARRAAPAPVEPSGHATHERP
jgi:AraC-like DNA-binding protein